MSKYKIIHGFALTNKRFLKKLEKYSAKGWHFKKYLIFFMLLEKGEEKNYKYSLVFDKKFNRERGEFYASNGWYVVRNSYFWQILRGEPNAVELYTDTVSEQEMWKQRIKFNSIIALVVLSLGGLLTLIDVPSVYYLLVEFLRGFMLGAGVAMLLLNLYFYMKYRSLNK